MSAPVLLRAAGGATVGIGHLMRARAIAHALEARGAAFRCFVDDAACAAWLDRRGIRADVSDAGESWAQLDASGAWLDGFRDWRVAIDRLTEHRTPVVLAENRTEARERCTTLVYPSLHWLPDRWDEENATRVRGGAGWIPLAREVIARSPAAKRDVDLLVTFGGSDPMQLTERVLSALAAIGYPGRVVVTVGPNMGERLDTIARGASRLRAAKAIRGDHGIVTWITRAKAAVAAVQTTLYELAYFGVPALVLANYESDAEALGYYAARGPHRPLGIGSAVSDSDLAARLGAALESVFAAPERTLAARGGAARIASLLVCGEAES